MMKLRYLDGWPVKKVSTAFLPRHNNGENNRKRRSVDTISESAISLTMSQLIRDIRTDLGVHQWR